MADPAGTGQPTMYVKAPSSSNGESPSTGEITPVERVVSGETTRRNSNENEKEKRSASTEKPSETIVDVPSASSRGVDVEKAKAEFDNLQRSISRRSTQSRNGGVLRRRSSISERVVDPEKGGDHGEEFDLADYLATSDLGHHPDTGFKFKSLGVTWDDLTVVGPGGMKLNIRTFP